jgi:hypothetical protein
MMEYRFLLDAIQIGLIALKDLVVRKFQSMNTNTKIIVGCYWVVFT